MTVRNFFIKKGRRNDYPFYRQVWVRVVLALLTASLLPLIAIGGGVTSYTFQIIESRTLDNLRQQVRRHQQAIDDFLDERECGLKLIAALHSLSELMDPGRLENAFKTLQEQLPGFTDLGVIDMQGVHRAYVGPYALTAVNYGGEEWFLALMDQDRYISDVYLGFRQAPHFIIAVKQGQGEDAYILRATVDSNRFDALVGEGMGDLNAESFIVNRDGVFQTRSGGTGDLLAPSGIQPDPLLKEIHLIPREDELTLTLWQEKVPWLSVVRVKRSEIFAAFNRARLAVTLTFILGGGLIALTVLLTTGNLVRLLEAKGQRLRVLDSQLRRTSHLSSSMELSLGFFEEIKDIFANIDISVKWLTDRDASGDREAPDLNAQLAQIAGEASRGHQLIDRFSVFVRDEDPIVTEVQVNDLLDDLLAFLHKELARRGIQVIRDFQTQIPLLRSDGAKLRQVFQNLFLNAVSALGKGGRIHLSTRSEDNHVMVVVGDTGPGIPADDHIRIFEPLYTTNPRGTGLGLSICRTILDQLGGSISVDSGPGQGAAFRVRLPCRMI